MLPELFVRVRDGKDEQECEGGSREEGEERGLGQGVDIVEGEAGREAELVDEVGHDFGVVLWAQCKFVVRRRSESTGQPTKRHKGLFGLRNIDILVTSRFSHVVRADIIVMMILRWRLPEAVSENF